MRQCRQKFAPYFPESQQTEPKPNIIRSPALARAQTCIGSIRSDRHSDSLVDQNR